MKKEEEILLILNDDCNKNDNNNLLLDKGHKESYMNYINENDYSKDCYFVFDYNSGWTNNFVYNDVNFANISFINDFNFYIFLFLITI